MRIVCLYSCLFCVAFGLTTINLFGIVENHQIYFGRKISRDIEFRCRKLMMI